MGRAIKPVAVCKETATSEVEVLSASGFWTRLSLLSEASRDALEAALKLKGLVASNELNGPCYHQLDDLDETPETPYEPIPQDYFDDGTDDGDGGEDESPNQSPDQGQGEGNGGDTTIEDIVRRIAGELDTEQDKRNAPLIINAMTELVDAKLAGFQPKLGGGGDGEGELFTITTRIEVTTPKGKKLKNGIFHKQFDKLTKLVAAGQHCYLPGPPGTGKSHAAEQVASVLDWRFASISLGPTTPESRLWGGMDAHGKFFEPPFVTLARHAQDNPDSGSVFCLDELDNGHAGVIATLNSAMANGWFTAPNGDVIAMGKNMVLVGAANTFGTGPTAEFAGRNKLDAATLDRFVYLPWDTDLAVEKALVLQYLDTQAARAWLEVWRTCRKNVKDHGLRVFVSMRGCVNGARLIASGLDPNDVLDMVLLSKLPDDQARKVKP